MFFTTAAAKDRPTASSSCDEKTTPFGLVTTRILDYKLTAADQVSPITSLQGVDLSSHPLSEVVSQYHTH